MTEKIRVTRPAVRDMNKGTPRAEVLANEGPAVWTDGPTGARSAVIRGHEVTVRAVAFERYSVSVDGSRVPGLFHAEADAEHCAGVTVGRLEADMAEAEAGE